jgi:hypothetical protein
MTVKTFYSAQDIENLVARGQTELVLDEDTVLTHLARDAAHKLGLKLIQPSSVSATAARPTSSDVVAGTGLKPKGCQHGPLPGSSSAPAKGSANSDKTVDDLVELVKGLSKGDDG